MSYKEEYKKWCEDELFDEETKKELKEIENNEEEIEERFYKELEFGTAGLRGIMGAGLNRMNKYTVGKATQGVANFIKNEKAEERGVAIAYDSRNNSKEFGKLAALVLNANGIKTYLYESLRSVPQLSYAVRKLNTIAGIMITASHNPPKYNGYKVYGDDGCQITTEAASEILSFINALDIFHDIKKSSFDDGIANGNIAYIDDSVLTSFIEEVKKQSVLFGDNINTDVSIVYSPLNGTGLKPVIRTLSEIGFKNVTVDEEQRNPDGNFPTSPYPNPEIKEAMALGIEYAKKYNADLLLATDPDCDRCGIAVKDSNGEHQLLSGNEVGLLLLDYICAQRTKHGKMPKTPVFVKTIVTVDLAEKIASHYGVSTVNVLTGFKFIGEVIGGLEAQGRVNDYICGFEESYGYLTGSYVRDKDGVNAAFLICEMFAFYKSRGISLFDKLNELYKTYGYCLNTLHSYEFDGSAGMAKMKAIMEKFHKGLSSIAEFNVVKTLDYSHGLDGLPSSDVLKFILENGSVVIRPSGTEPKLKAYISVTAEDREKASDVESSIEADLSVLLK